ncbi:MAG: TPD domain-containing protein, partial [Thermoplasmata archaeon]|nr:TPD domain-containing protein [Thermoplasmata archaeon]
NQLTPYYDLYGTGAVAYWLGYLDDLKAPEGIQLLGPEFFER